MKWYANWAHREVRVILSSRNPRLGEEAQARLKREGLEVDTLVLNVTDDSSCDQALRTVESRYGRLDILVNNAGIMVDRSAGKSGLESEASILTTPLQLIRESIETNTLGALRVSQKSVPLMLQGKYGRIVNISSGMGQLSEMNGGWPGYRISKTALNAVTRIFADELQGTPILVNSACPGWVKTDMGGPQAELTPQEGADTIVWLATLPDGGPTGGFFRERKLISW